MHVYVEGQTHLNIFERTYAASFGEHAYTSTLEYLLSALRFCNNLHISHYFSDLFLYAFCMFGLSCLGFLSRNFLFYFEA